MGARPRTVLLTGASGVVCRALVEWLGDVRVIGLVHTDEELSLPGEVLRCDLREERLGLSQSRWDALAREVDSIVHSGALTTWGQPYERYEAINIGGTARVVELAQRAGAPVHYVSTSFVNAIERGLLGDIADDNVVKPYIRSKLAAEAVLRESGVPHSVFRATNLVGDSRTGASSRPQIVQRMSAWVLRGKAPYLPARPGNRLDVVPVDVLAAVIAGAVAEGVVGGPWWVTYGTQAMTSEEARDVVLAHARALGRDVRDVPIVDPCELLPIPLEEVSATSRKFLKVLIDASVVTHACGGAFPSSMPELEERFALPRASDRDAYRLSLEYWSARRTPVPAGAKGAA